MQMSVVNKYNASSLYETEDCSPQFSTYWNPHYQWPCFMCCENLNHPSVRFLAVGARGGGADTADESGGGSGGGGGLAEAGAESRGALAFGKPTAESKHHKALGVLLFRALAARPFWKVRKGFQLFLFSSNTAAFKWPDFNSISQFTRMYSSEHHAPIFSFQTSGRRFSEAEEVPFPAPKIGSEEKRGFTAFVMQRGPLSLLSRLWT